jgi:hypothetical protein
MAAIIPDYTTMILRCFSIEELEGLSEHQLMTLQHAGLRTLRNNKTIKKILRERVNPLRERFAAKTAVQQPQRSALRAKPKLVAQHGSLP